MSQLWKLSLGTATERNQWFIKHGIDAEGFVNTHILAAILKKKEEKKTDFQLNYLHSAMQRWKKIGNGKSTGHIVKVSTWYMSTETLKCEFYKLS